MSDQTIEVIKKWKGKGKGKGKAIGKAKGSIVSDQSEKPKEKGKKKTFQVDKLYTATRKRSRIVPQDEDNMPGTSASIGSGEYPNIDEIVSKISELSTDNEDDGVENIPKHSLKRLRLTDAILSKDNPLLYKEPSFNVRPANLSFECPKHPQPIDMKKLDISLLFDHPSNFIGSDNKVTMANDLLLIYQRNFVRAEEPVRVNDPPSMEECVELLSDIEDNL